MAASGKLGILVQSGNYFDFVEKLTAAAGAKGKEVQIHLLGLGVTLVQSHDFDRLGQQARITICSSSFDKQFMEKKPPVPKGVTFVRREKIIDFVQCSDRCVVF